MRQRIRTVKSQRPAINNIPRKKRMTTNNILLAGADKLPYYTPDHLPAIAIIQTGSWGDNINSTLMFEPIKKHYNNQCMIDVYTSTYYASAFYNNPHIDKIIRYTARDKESSLHLTLTIPDTIRGRGYTRIITPHPMFNHECWSSSKYPELGENLIYAWVHALEREKIECPIPPISVMKLEPHEIQNVSLFCRKIKMDSMRNILMECHGESGQTFWDHNWTMAVGQHLLKDPNTNLFISRRHTSSDIDNLTSIAPNRVHFVGGLSIRECAELFNKCQVFMSVSSGLSNACNTTWCKKDIKWIETTNSSVVTSAPIRREGKIFWHDNNITNFITMLLENGI